MWYLYIGCSPDITGDLKSFITLEAKSRGIITFGYNTTKKEAGESIIRLADNFSIENVFASRRT